MPISTAARLAAGAALVLTLVEGALAAPSAALAAEPAAPPPTLTVNSLADVVAVGPLNNSICETAPGNHTCTLRAAVMKANHFPGGGVTIDLPAGAYNLTIAPAGLDDETTGDLNISQTVTINGVGATITIVDASQIDRLLRVAAGTVVLSNLTLRNGLAPSLGGAILNFGQLILNNDVLSGNQSSPGSAAGAIANGPIGGPAILTLNNTVLLDNLGGGNAGALYNATNSLATLNNSRVSNNRTLTGGYGGGLVNSGAMTLTNSLVSGNQTTPQTSNPVAGNAGGIWNAGGVLTLINSTVSNNSAWGAGGGIENDATLNTYFSTIAGNLADSYAANAKLGGGIYNLGDPVNLGTSLLAQNYAAAARSDGSGDFHSLDYNLIQNTTGMTLSGATSHNLTGLDPLIDSPKNYGGSTAVRALLAGSPALDAVPLDHCTGALGEPLTHDQRGFPRPVNGLCDIGAFEGQQPAIGYHLNVVRNGDAEGAAGSPNPLGAFVGVPVWTSVAQLMTTVPYNTAGGFPAMLTDTVPANHDRNFFAGGVGAGTSSRQIIDLSAVGTRIDAGGVSYDFSADLGGDSTDNDNAKAEADFYDGGSNLLSSVVLGPVTAADRGNQTALLHRAAASPVPVHTRSVILYVIMSRANGSYDDGYADNIALILLPRASLFLPGVIR